MLTAGPVQLDDPHPDFHILKLFCQIIGDGAAAHDHGIFHLVGFKPYLPEKVRRIRRGRNDGDEIPVLQDKVTIRYINRLIALRTAEQNIAVIPVQ